MPSPQDESRPSLRVVPLPGKGRGIVAGDRIASGQVVDAAPVIVIPARSSAVVQETVLGRYTFTWDERTGSVALALGRVSLLNHSYTPNLAAEKRTATRTIAFIALRDVDKGEELTINYHGDADCRDPVWFPVVGT
ncbi:MAG: SET domain-containing protein-lysine N-methyltransferase [Acidimicrobiales bacterium]